MICANKPRCFNIQQLNCMLYDDKGLEDINRTGIQGEKTVKKL